MVDDVGINPATKMRAADFGHGETFCEPEPE